MKKRIIAIVAIIALVAILGIVFVACNADSYVKKLEDAGYFAYSMDKEDFQEMGLSEEDVKELGIEWAAYGIKVGLRSDVVMVIKVKNAEDAKKVEEEVGKDGLVEVQGKIVFFATSQEGMDVVK